MMYAQEPLNGDSVRLRAHAGIFIKDSCKPERLVRLLSPLVSRTAFFVMGCLWVSVLIAFGKPMQVLMLLLGKG
jgi:hypothetical protein